MLGEEEYTDSDFLEHIWLFSIIWAFGGCLTPDSRAKFDAVLKRISGKHLAGNASLFDIFFDYSGTKNWILWEKVLPKY